MGIEEKRLALKRARLEAARNAVGKTEPDTAWGDSALRGAAQGVSFGFADEGAGALEAAKDIAFGDKKLGDFKDLYDQHRDESRVIYDKAEKDNPVAYGAGSVAGAVGSAFIPGLGWANAAKGATLAGRLGTAALAGGVAGAGSSKADPTKSPDGLKNFLTDSAIGGAVGAAGQGLGEAGGKIVSKAKNALPQFLDQFSEWNILKAAGAMTRDRKALRHQGKSAEVADFLRKKGVVSFGSTVDDAVERSKSIQSKSKEEIADALMMLDDYVGRSSQLEPVAMEMTSQPMQSAVNSVADEVAVPVAGGAMTRLPPPKGSTGILPSEVAEKIKAELIDPMMQGPRAAKRVAGKLQAEADDLAARGDSPMSFVDANKLKNKYYDLIGDYGKEKSPDIEGLKKFAGILNKSIEEKADEVATASGDKALFNSWKQAKKDFGNAATVHNMSANRADQIRTNNPFGLTDYITGAAAVGGGLSNDSPGSAALALPLMLANRTARTRGASAMGISANKLSSFIKSPPPGLSKYANVLTNALKRGNTSLAATHLWLMNNEPDYAKAMEAEHGSK